MYRWEKIKNDPILRKNVEAAIKIRQLIRQWFAENNFLEVETPALVHLPGQEPYLTPFDLKVHDENGKVSDGSLITSPEYSLKKLLAAGYSKVFELARVFRNSETADDFHNPEFTMLEWYRKGTDYRGIMEDAEQLIFFIFQQLNAKRYTLNAVIDFTPPWERMSLREAFKRYADIDLDKIIDAGEDGAKIFQGELEKNGLSLNGTETFDDCFFKIFLTKIEKNLGRGKPTILYDYPAGMASLSRIKKDDTRYAERFEVYICGIEIANAFSELSDEPEQRARFLEEKKIKEKEGKKAYEFDEAFLAAVKSGLGECGGIAVGIDRLAMIMLDASSISDVLFFPWKENG